jgi:hypothetical protein
MYGGVEHAGGPGREVKVYSSSNSRINEHKRKSIAAQPGILVRYNATADEATLDLLDISWELILLLSAEFLIYGLAEIPLMSSESDAVNETNFIKDNRWLTPTVLSVYILLTLPVAMGYNWFIQQWPLDLIVMLGIYTSLAAVCHLASVYSNPSGVFVGCCSLSLFLFILSIVKFCIPLGNKFFSFSNIYLALIGIAWHVIVFLVIYLVGGILTPFTCLGSAIVAVVVTIFILAELRLIENKICVFFTQHDNRIDRKQAGFPPPSISVIARAEAEVRKERILERDPFTLAIWINCATWRFLIQLAILLQKIIFEIVSLFFLSLLAIWRFIVSLFAQRTPGNWLAPETVRKLFRLNKATNVPS